MGMSYSAAAITPDQVAQLTGDPDADDILDLIDEGIDLGELFMEVQVLITGRQEYSEPLFAGDPLGEDLGAGPALLVDAADTARIAGDLVHLTRAELESRFDLDAMDGPFTNPDMFLDNPDGGAEELATVAMELVDLYRHAAACGHSIIYSIT